MKAEIVKGMYIRARERTNLDWRDRGSCAKRPEVLAPLAHRRVWQAVGYWSSAHDGMRAKREKYGTEVHQQVRRKIYDKSQR